MLLFWWLIHLPDDDIPGVLANVRRVLKPGGVVLIGFHLGSGTRLKTEGYGGHPMRVLVHQRSIADTSEWLREAGFEITAELVLNPGAATPGGVVVARRNAE